MKTRVKIKFVDGEEKTLNNVHLVITDSRSMFEIGDNSLWVIFTDDDKGEGLLKAEKDAIETLDLSLYSDTDIKYS